MRIWTNKRKEIKRRKTSMLGATVARKRDIGHRIVPGILISRRRWIREKRF